jgi:hypothetical protein
MVEAMKKVAKLDVELTVEERNLLSVGYKNVIGARRASWRILSSIEQKEESKGNEQNVRRIKDYRHKVEEELAKICSDILTIIDGHLIPSSSTGESTVFYYKMYCIFALLNCWSLLCTCFLDSVSSLLQSCTSLRITEIMRCKCNWTLFSMPDVCVPCSCSNLCLFIALCIGWPEILVFCLKECDHLPL